MPPAAVAPLNPPGTALERVLALLRDRGPVERRGKDWRCVCPAHADATPSLDVAQGDSCVVFACRSQKCRPAAIANALGLSMADLWDDVRAAGRLGFEDRIVRTYDYRDEAGAVLFQTVRLAHPKDFRQRRFVPGGYEWNLQGVRRVLYRLPELTAAAESEIVFACEGEKDADAVAALGLVATTCPMGAGKWRAEYGRPLKGRRVVALADNDDAGRQHAAQVAAALKGTAAAAVALELPGLPPKGDASDWLAAGGTKEKLLELAAAAMPAPAPAPARPPADEWPVPVPLEDDAAGVPPFPLDVLPPPLAGFAGSVAARTNTPPDYAGTYVLGISAGLIGATLAVKVDDEWTEPAVLYACVVAPKSRGKTPCFLAVMRPVARIQAERSHRSEKTRPYAADTTIEAIAPVLQANPRGLLVARDELSSWAKSFDQYKAKGSGSDRQFWLANWSGEPLDVTRRNPEAPHVHIAHPCVSVVGGIQPAVVEALRGGADDGFMERLLFAYPPPLPAARHDRGRYAGKDEWTAVVGSLLALEMEQGDYGPRSRRLRLSAAAEGLFDDWTQETAEANNDPDRDPALDGVRTKLNGLVARLALVLHALWRVAGRGPIGPEVEVADIDKAIRLGRYFLAHAARVHGLSAAGDPRLPLARRIAVWVCEKRPAAFTRRDVYAALRRSVPQPEALADPLKLLVQLGQLRYADAYNQAGPGRRPDARYEVNPRFPDPRTQNPQNSFSPGIPGGIACTGPYTE